MAEVELPTGWEQRFDERSGKSYFINHEEKKTQWNDPRLYDTLVWSGNNAWRTEALNALKLQFASCPEALLREGLIQSRFNTGTVVRALLEAGYEQTQHSYKPPGSGVQRRTSAEARRPSSQGPTRVGSASSPRTPTVGASTTPTGTSQGVTRVGSVSSPRSPPARTSPIPTASSQTGRGMESASSPISPTARVSTVSPAPTSSSRRSTNASVNVPRVIPEEGVDMFNVLHLKSQFSTVTEGVIMEVLASCRNSVEKAAATLKSMGFEDAAAIEVRLEEESSKQRTELRRIAEELRQREQERDRMSKLNAEFPMLPNGRVTETLAACGHNYEKARAELLAMENRRSLAQEFDMSDDVIYRLLDAANQDVNDVRQQIEQIRLAKKRDQESQRCIANGPDSNSRKGPDESLLLRRTQRAAVSTLLRSQSPAISEIVAR